MRTVISKDGTPIAFDQSGQGPTLILVAGALSTRVKWSSLAARLAPQFRVFAYDRRGRGESGDTAPYAVEREVEDLEALMLCMRSRTMMRVRRSSPGEHTSTN